MHVVEEQLDILADAQRRERRRALMLRVLLYGAPFLAALLTLSIRQVVLSTDVVNWADIDGVVFANAFLAALVSAAAAFWLPNRIAVRIVHAISAAIVSACIYILLITIAESVSRYFSIIPY